MFIHLPKTGGTFVATAISQYYGGYYTGKIRDFQAKTNSLIDPFCFRSRFKHLARHHIPPVFSHLPVIGTIRNPYSRYVSQYLFGTWRSNFKQYPGIEKHPDFPDISFRDFVKLTNHYLWLVCEKEAFRKHDVGWQTATLLHWYGRRDALLSRIRGPTASMLTATTLQEILNPCKLIRMEHLRDDLVSVLSEVGYAKEKLQFIFELPKILPVPEHVNSGNGDLLYRENSFRKDVISQPTIESTVLQHSGQSESWRRYFDQETLKLVNRKERLLFDMFPHWYTKYEDAL